MISCFVNILCNTPAVASTDMLQKILRLRRYKLEISMRKLQIIIQSGPKFKETWKLRQYKSISYILPFSQCVILSQT